MAKIISFSDAKDPDQELSFYLNVNGNPVFKIDFNGYHEETTYFEIDPDDFDDIILEIQRIKE